MWLWWTLGAVAAAGIGVAAIYGRRQRRRGGVRGSGEIQRHVDNRPPPTDPGIPPWG